MCVCVCVCVWLRAVRSYACKRSLLYSTFLSAFLSPPFLFSSFLPHPPFLSQINSGYGKLLSQNLNHKDLQVITSAKELRNSLNKVTFEKFCPVTEFSGLSVHKKRKQMATTPLHLAYGILQSSKLIILRYFFQKLRNSFLHNGLRITHAYSDSECACVHVCAAV